MTPYEQHWAFARWSGLATRVVLNADVWARLGREALRAGMVPGNNVDPAEEES
jgi:hypothetical protein